MRLATPHMGSLYDLLADLFSRMGVDYHDTPRTTERTVNLGVKYSPEFACLPLKITVGNFVEALETGADTLLMIGGIGPCRFGYYAEIQKRVLKEAGYGFDFITLEPPKVGWINFISTIKQMAPGCSVYSIYRHIRDCFRKAQVLDMLEKKWLELAAYDETPGDTTKAYAAAQEIVKRVTRPEELADAQHDAFSIMDGVRRDHDRKPLRIGIIGEFYLLLEPFFKFDIEPWLIKRGVSVDRGVYLTDWIGPTTKNPVAGMSAGEIEIAADPYLKHTVGGDGLASIGHAVHYAKEGFDGIVHLLPFTCMPDTIAKALLVNVSEDYGIPVLSMIVDEQTGKAGVHTRLEAFLDLMANRRRSWTRT